MYHFCVCDIFLSPGDYRINLIFQCQYVFMRCFWWRTFPRNYQNAYGHQTFQVGDMRQRALTHKYTWHLNRVFLLGYVTNKMHIHLQKIYWHHNRLGADIVLETPKHDPLISSQHEVTWLKNLYLYFHEVYS